MTYTVIHHSVSKQDISEPSQMGGKWQFYNVVITAKAVFRQHTALHPRGPFSSFDVCVTGDFRTDVPTAFQLEQLRKIIAERKDPFIGHNELKKYGATIGTLVTECPAKLPKYLNMKINIATVGMSQQVFDAFKAKAAEFGVEIERTEYQYNLPTTLQQDAAYFVANTIDAKEKYVFFCLQSNLSWQMSYYYPKLNQCISVMTLNGTPSAYAFELKHQLFLWFNENRGSLPALENKDWNAPTDDMIRTEFGRIMPYSEILEGLRVEDQNMSYRLVRASKDIYRLRDGAKDLFLNAESFQALDGRWDGVESITQQELDSIPDGYVLIAVKQE